MLFVREMMCFNLNMPVKMYPKMYIFLFGCTFCNLSVQGPPPPLCNKMISPRIWKNLKNDPENVKNRGIPRICGTLTCLYDVDIPPLQRKKKVTYFCTSAVTVPSFGRLLHLGSHIHRGNRVWHTRRVQLPHSSLYLELWV